KRDWSSDVCSSDLALQRRAFVVIAGELGAGGGVKQGGVGIKHRQQPAAGQPLQPQHHAAGRGRILGGGGGAADLHAVDGGGKLAVPRGDGADREAAVVRRKGNFDRGA